MLFLAATYKQQMGKMFVGVEGVEEAFVVQPSLHNLKGGISRACGVVGRVLPLEDACELFRYVATVAPRYKVADIPVDSKQYCSLVRRRFRNGISFTGREAREFLSFGGARLCTSPAFSFAIFVVLPHCCSFVCPRHMPTTGGMGGMGQPPCLFDPPNFGV